MTELSAGWKYRLEEEDDVLPHFALPARGPGGKTPTTGTSTCRVCDKTIERMGHLPNSDGGKGQWRHT